MAFEGNALVLVMLDRDPNLRRRFAQLGLLISKEAFLGAGGAFCPVQALKAAAQAGVSQRAITAAVAGELISNAGHFGHLLINVPLL